MQFDLDTTVDSSDQGQATTGNLKDRLGSKLYLYSDASRHGHHATNDVGLLNDTQPRDDEDEVVDGDGPRPNALFLTGTPISALKTQELFAYADHFDSRPMGLEWIDDTSLIFVYPSNSAARHAYQRLRRSTAQGMDADGFVSAKPIPIDLWPKEFRISISLATEVTSTEQNKLKGLILLRKASLSDVKQKGAKSVSKFYKQYGASAGKEMYAEDLPRVVRQKRKVDGDASDVSKKARLDAELTAIREDDGHLHNSVNDRHENAATATASSEPSALRRKRGNADRNRKPHPTQEELDSEYRYAPNRLLELRRAIVRIIICLMDAGIGCHSDHGRQ